MTQPPNEPATAPTQTGTQPPRTGLVAVVGATGQQGGAVARRLLADGVPVRALTRDLASSAATALRDAGAELAQADLQDPDSVRRAFDGAERVFLVTTMSGERGTEGETADGVVAVDAARAAGVAHLVYSSVGGAERETGIPHFESKRRVEEHVEEVGVPHTFVRPVFFYENLLAQPPAVEDGTLVVRLALPAGVALQMVAVETIGAAAAAALADPSSVPGGAVELAGDELTGEQLADVFGAQADLPARYEAAPTDVLPTEDYRLMFEWFARLPAYQADRALTADLAGGAPSLADWLAARDWRPQA